MVNLRIIHTSKQATRTENADERIQFTEDLDSPVGEFIIPGYDLESDIVVEVDELPGTFPSEHEFKRSN